MLRVKIKLFFRIISAGAVDLVPVAVVAAEPGLQEEWYLIPFH